MSFRSLLILGVAVEALIFIVCWLFFDTPGEVFKYAARYSGRVSLAVYLGCFYYFAVRVRGQKEEGWLLLKQYVTLFCVLHLIHFGFLAANIWLNQVELVPIRLAGGILAYLMIVAYPWLIDRFRSRQTVHLIYFYYVGLVMMLTYVARLNGGVDGHTPAEAFHYIGLFGTAAAMVLMGVNLWQRKTSKLP